MFSLRWTIIILFSLFVPFCLRTLGIEPYPAVLLPAGGGSIKKVNNHVALETKKLYALDSSGNWKKINLTLFLYPIPIQYSPNLISYNFGLSMDSSKFRSKGFRILKKLHLASETTASKDKIREIEDWLKKKLIEQHFNPSKIKLTSYIQTISADTGDVLDNKIKDERIISLDQ